jgi:2-dehydro-3-deoxyphosphogluconate aldolase / (4S)-4-hydroxy-2-oxoglutarate aldolase
MDATEARNRLYENGLIAILRGNFPSKRIEAIAEALFNANWTVIEVTLNTPGALTALRRLRDLLGSAVLIGAGTVRTVDQLQAAMDAGAGFSVAPNLDLATVALAQQQNLLHLPGVFTPGEAEVAYRAGCRVVKLFPSILGPTYLKALRAPLDEIDFVPTGGVTLDNVAAFRRAGAVAVGVGSALSGGSDEPLPDLERRARAFRRAWTGEEDAL